MQAIVMNRMGANFAVSCSAAVRTSDSDGHVFALVDFVGAPMDPEVVVFKCLPVAASIGHMRLLIVAMRYSVKFLT